MELASAHHDGLSPRVPGNLPITGITQASQVYPRVYGGTNASQSHCTPVRSIPACTGEPALLEAIKQIPVWVYPRVYGGTEDLGAPSACAYVRVYPRVYGGTDACQPPVRLSDGLSPRVRGNPISIPSDAMPIGSIPACTGEPCHEYHEHPQ